MTLQTDVLAALKKYSVDRSMIYYRRWTPQWTINDFAETLIELIEINQARLTDTQLRNFIAGAIQLLKPFPELQAFIAELQIFVTDNTVADPEGMLKFVQRYREKFCFIPPVETESAVVMMYGLQQTKYMRLAMDLVAASAERLKHLSKDDITYDNFINELESLGMSRQSVAVQCNHSNPLDFGDPRWIDSDANIISTNLAASNYKTLKLQCLNGRQASRVPGAGSEQYFINANGAPIPVTKLSWDTRDEHVWFEHTPSQNLNLLLREAFKYWKIAMQPDCKPHDLIRAIAAQEYILQHAMPYKRGSAAIVTSLSYALYKKHGYEMIPAKANTAIYYNALATRSLEDFVNAYEVSFVVSPTAIKMQPDKNKFIPQVLTPKKIQQIREILAKVNTHEASSSTTPFYQAISESNLSQLKRRIDSPDVIYDKDITTDVKDYCEKHHDNFAKEIRNTLIWQYDRDKSEDVVILWQVTPTPTHASTAANNFAK